MERVEFPLAGGGGSVVVETDEPAPAADGRRMAARGLGGIAEAGKTFEEALSGIRPIAEAILAQIKESGPDSVAVEFGIKLSAAAGIVLTSTSGEAHCKITLSWKKA